MTYSSLTSYAARLRPGCSSIPYSCAIVPSVLALIFSRIRRFVSAIPYSRMSFEIRRRCGLSNVKGRPRRLFCGDMVSSLFSFIYRQHPSVQRELLRLATLLVEPYMAARLGDTSSLAPGPVPYFARSGVAVGESCALNARDRAARSCDDESAATPCGVLRPELFAA